MKPDKPITRYHVMTRVAQKQFWFRDDEFKTEARQILEAFAEIYMVDVSAFVFMSNHAHLAITMYKPEEVDEEDVQRRFDLLQGQLKHPKKWRKRLADKYFKRFTDLSMFMWEINYRIACAHNRRYNGWGHFWGARFKSILLEDEAALMRVNQYIEANPVRAEMVEKPSEYEHCSAGQLARALERKEEPELEPRAWLANYKPEFRARAYVLIQDYLAWLYHNPEMRNQPKPPEYACLDFANFDMDQYDKDLVEGALTNWGRGVCGSDEFIEKMTGRPPDPPKKPPGGPS